MKHNPINTATLSRKYKCSVSKLIENWKKDKSDYEAAQSLGLDIYTVIQIRQEIMSIQERTRTNKKSGYSQFKEKPR